MDKVLYLGKSCRDFTHDKAYKCFGIWHMTPSDQDILNGKNYVDLTIYGNRGNMIRFNDDYMDYVYDNFKLINDKEYEQHIRKNKIKKINKYGIKKY